MLIKISDATYIKRENIIKYELLTDGVQYMLYACTALGSECIALLSTKELASTLILDIENTTDVNVFDVQHYVQYRRENTERLDDSGK